MHVRDEMPSRLAAFLQLRRADVDEVEVTEYEPIAGGYSRVMARARVRYRSGETALEETLVLRGDPPPGVAMIETDRDAEWRMLAALTDLDGVRVPTARHYDDSGEHLGTKAIVMEHVPGGSLQARIEGADDFGDHPERLARAMGRINRIEPDQLPADLPRPVDGDARVDELIAMWRTGETNSGNSDPVARYVAAWLDAHRPPAVPLRLTHGDPQAPNVVLDDDGDYVVVDWEFASIGDPREDLGWYNLYSSAAGPNLYEADPEAFLAAYRDETGFDESQVNQLTVGYFTILSSVKVGAPIHQQIVRFARGENAGVMTAMQIGSVMFGHGTFLDAVAGLDAAHRAIQAGA